MKIIIVFDSTSRYIGYSYINCAWYAFPFEAMEVFTFFSLQVNFKRCTVINNIIKTFNKVGAAKFVAEHAPRGMLATLTGLQVSFKIKSCHEMNHLGGRS